MVPLGNPFKTAAWNQWQWYYMTKRREQQKKRRESKEEQAAMHDRQRLARALADYEGSIQENVDNVNERIRAVGGEDAASSFHWPRLQEKEKAKSREDVNQKTATTGLIKGSIDRRLGS
jgi:outer membrane protein assembly factor BamE (lipoprotein component of BamABCDE complex)